MSVTISWPDETIRSNPIPRSLKASAANAEPEWLTNVTGPVRRTSGVSNPVARRRPGTFRNPIPFPPQSGMPASAAIAATRCTSGGAPGSGGSGSKSDENVTTLRAPAATASRSAASMRAFATPRIARSTGSGTSRIDGKHRRSSIEAYPGLTGKT